MFKEEQTPNTLSLFFWGAVKFKHYSHNSRSSQIPRCIFLLTLSSPWIFNPEANFSSNLLSRALKYINSLWISWKLETRKETHKYCCHQGKDRRMVFSLFQHQIIPKRAPQSAAPDLQRVCPSRRADTLVNVTEGYIGSSASTSHRGIHRREQCCVFLDCGKIFSEFMPFIILKGICIQDVLMLAVFIAVEPLASNNKAAMHTEALCPQNICNSSLSSWQSFPSFFHMEYQIFNKAWAPLAIIVYLS